MRAENTRHVLGPRTINTRSREMSFGTTEHATGASCQVKDPRVHATAYDERARLMAGDTYLFSHGSTFVRKK